MDIFLSLLLCCCFVVFVAGGVLTFVLYVIFNNVKLKALLLAGKTKELFSKYSMELFKRDVKKMLSKLLKSSKSNKKSTKKEFVDDAEFIDVEE